MKFKKLKSKLGVPQFQAVGILESIWMFTAKNAPQGDIGKFSNEDIAVAIEWPGCPDKLVEALVEYGWLDPSDEKKARICVHDWGDHMPMWCKANLIRWKKPVKIGVSTR